VAAIGGAVALAAAGAAAANAWWFKPLSINVFYERVFLRYVLRDPELLTVLGMLRPYGITAPDGRLTDVSDRRLQENQAFVRSELATLRSYDTTALSPSQRLSSEILDWYLDDLVRGQQFAYHQYAINAYDGVQAGLPELLAVNQPVRSAADARRYIRRLTAFGEKFDQLLEGLRIRDRRGLVPPRIVADEALAQMRAFVATPPRQSVLYTALAAKLDSAGVGADDGARLLGAAEREIAGTVYPAYGRLIAFEAGLAARAGDDVGAWHLPGGDRYYAWALRHYTTTDLSPDSLHALGLGLVSRIEAEMTRVLDSLRLPGPDIGSRLRALAADPRFRYATDSAGRARSLADATALVASAERRVPAAFGRLPRARVVVRPVPAFREAAAAGAYYSGPSLDGSRPGIFFVNLARPPAVWQLPTLAYHEAVPGHHFQIAIAQELSGVPTFRTVIPFTAYIEGWGLYAERLAYELGLDPDAYSVLGYREAELLRAVRLVVDTGIHWKRWPRDQAIAYMAARMADTADARAEADRYIVDPGQACAYMAGELTLLALRDRARRELGPAFDLRRFHAVVLENGAMPLAVLERQVDAYIARERGGR
jgi:uncharacterized protein (DUF885 family)